MNDLRFALRQFLKHPGFTAVAVLTLVLGVGANTAIFSFFNSMLLRPLPFHEPGRLVMVFENNPERNSHKDAVGAPMLGEWRRRTQSFEGLAACESDDFILTGGGQPETLPVASVSANTFNLLGVKPLLGRDFLPDEEGFGNHHVAILSYEFWQRRFGGDTKVVGQSITLNSEPREIIGVMPPHTFFPDGNAKTWIPLAFSPRQLSQRHNHHYSVYGRLKPGVSLAQANSDMALVASGMAQDDPQNKGWGAEVYSLQEVMVGDSRSILLVLLGSVSLVLLIACANIANLSLVRAAGRSREFAIRSALGAGRRQIICQLLMESLALAAFGGLGGLLLGQAGLRLLVRLSPPNLPRLWEGVPFDWTTLAFTVGITLVAGLVFGLAPALQSSKATLTTDLNDSSRGSSGDRRGRRIRAVLVISEIAVSFVLLIGAGLMIRSFERLLSQPLGFVPEHVVTVSVGLPGRSYPANAVRARFFDQLLARSRTLPGIDSAALVWGLPLGAAKANLTAEVLGAPKPPAGEEVSAGYSQISEGYFGTMGIPVLRGRDFANADRSGSPAVVIVDETFVNNFKLGSNAVGKRVRVGDGTTDAEIIGVVRDVKRVNIAHAPQGEMYRPFRQNCWSSMDLVLRTRRNPADVMRAVRAEVEGLDKDLPILNCQSMMQLVASSVADRRLSVQLLGGFAGIALLLAAVGLYGVLAFTVAQRRREIGIRMALGASRRNVLRLVLGSGMRLVGVGIVLGGGAALGLTRLLAGMLYGVEPTDPATFGGVSFLLVLVALFACWIPARRATHVHPTIALTAE